MHEHRESEMSIEIWGEKSNAEQRRKQPKHLWRVKNNQVGSRLQGRLAYEPPRLHDLQQQNRVKARKYFPKKKSQQAQYHPHAPRNTTSFIMRAKSSGGIAPPTPSTPAVISTPDLSEVPSYREGITDEVNKEWGVNGYGSMNGLIRLKEDTGRNEESDSESDVDQGVQSVQQLEQRLDQDLNRFEILYTLGAGDQDVAGTQLNDQENHIAHLEEENLTLKERIYILEQQVEELKQKMAQTNNAGLDEMEVCSSDGAN